MISLVPSRICAESAREREKERGRGNSGIVSTRRTREARRGAPGARARRAGSARSGSPSSSRSRRAAAARRCKSARTREGERPGAPRREAAMRATLNAASVANRLAMAQCIVAEGSCAEGVRRGRSALAAPVVHLGVEHLGSVAHQQTRRVQLGCHVGELELQVLHAGQRLPKLLAHLAMRHCAPPRSASRRRIRLPSLSHQLRRDTPARRQCLRWLRGNVRMRVSAGAPLEVPRSEARANQC